jgi:hypothetical protein
MTDKLGNRLYNTDSLKARFDENRRGISRAGKIQRVSQVDELTSSLGLLESGEFRVGNQKPPTKGFTGVRMRYPGAIYDGEKYNLAGVNNDVLQWGGRVSDGVFLAGEGKVQIDVGGISIDNGAITGGRVATAINWDGGTITTYDDTDGPHLALIANLTKAEDQGDITLEARSSLNAVAAKVNAQSNNDGAGLTVSTIELLAGSTSIINAQWQFNPGISLDAGTVTIYTPLEVEDNLVVDGTIASGNQAATINSTGVIAATHRIIYVTGAGGGADNLDTVTGLVEDAIYIIKQATGSGTITIRDRGVTGSTFNLAGSNPIGLSNVRSVATFVCRDSSGTLLLDEVSRSAN